MSAETALVIAIAEKLAAPLAIAVGGAVIKVWRDVHVMKDRQSEFREEIGGEMRALLDQVAQLTARGGEASIAIVQITERQNKQDERHQENQRRFDRVDDKLDKLLQMMARPNT